MGYCALSDVQAEFKKIVFDSTQLVTDTAVNGFINEATALIDSYVGAKYVVPITGAKSLLTVSLFCRVLVADRVAGILANRQSTNSDANQNVKASGLHTADVLKQLDAIRRGDMVLYDATYLVVGAGFYSNNQATNEQAVFKKDTRQW